MEGAFYDIQHAGKTARVLINQAVYPNRFYAADGWIYVGKYNFTGTGSEFIRLTNQTQDESAAIADMELGADSVQFIYQGDATPTPPSIVTDTPTPTRTLTGTPTKTLHPHDHAHTDRHSHGYDHPHSHHNTDTDDHPHTVKDSYGNKYQTRHSHSALYKGKVVFCGSFQT